MSKRIVITGGPGTGKTALVRQLEQMGHTCLHEIIREMTLEAKKEGFAQAARNPLTFVQDPLEFNRKLLKARVRQFHSAEQLQEPLVFYDRGLPDILAYMRYFGQEYGQDFQAPCREMRYDTVVLLPPWKAIYRQDDERLEPWEEALGIHEHLVETYRDFGYQIETLPTGTLNERANRLLDIIAG